MIYYEILPQEQQKIYPKLDFAKDKGFILFGGTAIALQLGHRFSVDFDFFSSNVLDERLKDEILKKLGFDTILKNTPNSLVFEKDNVKISFFGDLEFVNKSSYFDLDNVLKVADLKSLLATKLKVLFERIELKDYIDIAEILKRGNITLQEGILEMYRYFDTTLLASDTLKALTDFNHQQLDKLSKEDRKFLIKNADEYIQQILNEEKSEIKSNKFSRRK